MNHIVIDGLLGRDPEIKSTTTGKTVAKFSLANDLGWGDSKKTSWFDIVAWGDLAETARRELSKGSKVTVYGRLASRSWEKDGQKRYAVEVVAAAFEVRKTDKVSSQPRTASQQEISDDDIPF